MKLVRVRSQTAEERFAFRLEDERLDLLPRGVTFSQALQTLADPSDGADREVVPADHWELLPPVPSPASLRDCVGFLQHIRNTRANRGELEPLLPVWQERPGFYFANPYCLQSATADVAIPAASRAFDFELEIAAVIGRGGRDLTAAQAADAIAGYVLFCDWSARDIQAEERTMQVGLGKGKDAAISLGPWILSAADAVPFRRADGLDIEVSAEINGARVTDSEARYVGMDWTFEEIVAYASVSVDLAVGDVIAAGTVPTGCLLERSAAADFRGWLAAGDQVRLAAGPLGEITTAIVAGRAPAQWRRA